jgi:hypothetical protein
VVKLMLLAALLLVFIAVAEAARHSGNLDSAATYDDLAETYRRLQDG